MDNNAYSKLLAEDPVLMKSQLLFVEDSPEALGPYPVLKIGDGKTRLSKLPWYHDYFQIQNEKLATAKISFREAIDVPLVLPAEYTGGPVHPRVYVVDPRAQIVSGDWEAIDVGHHTMGVTPTIEHTWWGGSFETKYIGWAIYLPFVSVPEPERVLKSDGMLQTPIWRNYDPEKMRMEGKIYAKDPGIYEVTFTPYDPYVWGDDETATPKTVTWEIK